MSTCNSHQTLIHKYYYYLRPAAHAGAPPPHRLQNMRNLRNVTLGGGRKRASLRRCARTLRVVLVEHSLLQGTR